MAMEKSKRKRSQRFLAIEDHQVAESSTSGASSSRSSAAEGPVPKKSRHRAETRDCPICNEPIPLRLLAKHAELEDSRLYDILGSIGSTEPYLDDSYTLMTPVASSSASASTITRRSAARARQTILQSASSVKAQSTPATKTIQTIKRNRKQRHAKLREMTREEEDGYVPAKRQYTSGEEIVCPVCLATVRGDEDVTDAHVNACIAGESRRLEEERERRALQEMEEMARVDIDDYEADGERLGHVGDVRGTGFHTRNENERDVEDDIDIDGDDAEVFGNAQFTEGDILDVEGGSASARTRPTSQRELRLDIERPEDEDQPEKVLRDLISTGSSHTVRELLISEAAQGITDANEIELTIQNARSSGDPNDLLCALEKKIKWLECYRIPTPSSPSSSSASASLLCRICLDPYNEPTVSTGCWHTCCRECWLRCLGSTKLCPICKRITAAIDLRRVYL